MPQAMDMGGAYWIMNLRVVFHTIYFLSHLEIRLNLIKKSLDQIRNYFLTFLPQKETKGTRRRPSVSPTKYTKVDPMFSISIFEENPF
jgi:hypothetical protein